MSKSLEKRKGSSLPVHGMMKSPKATKHLSSSSVPWWPGSSHLKGGHLVQGETRGTAGFELSWYTIDYLLWALLLLELHYMSNTLSDGSMYKTLQLNKGLWLSPVISCREVSFTKQWLSNLVHKSDLGSPLNPILLAPPQSSWLSRSGVWPETLHFYQAPTCC